MKPMLACDADLSKVTWPMIGMPKIDGVRALNIDGKLVARSGKPFKNKLNTDYFSSYVLNGFDGEMVAAELTDEKLCSKTTSAMNTIEGDVACTWMIFDYNGASAKVAEPYESRLEKARNLVMGLHQKYPELRQRIGVVEYVVLNSEQEAQEYFAANLERGFEGTILRDPNGPYKYGRCTAKEANYLRVKAFADAEIRITKIVEGMTNNNELKRGQFGQAERSTNAENMVPNGMVGSLIGELLEDIVVKGEVFLAKGTEVEIAAGKLTHTERRNYFEYPEDIIGKIAKFQYFPIGMKEKLRFPTFQTFRAEEDL